MEFGLVNILQLAGAVGIFIYGMKLMSDAIQRAAGVQFRATLSNITSNKWMSLLIGFVITGVIQSSSATTVMTVSFVNAGLISALESVGLILGANIGTTVTGWLVSYFGFKVSLVDYAVPIFAFGVPLLFISYGKSRYWGEFLIGFALIFLGLGFMRDSVPAFNENTLLFDWLKGFTDGGLGSRLFFVLVGTVITILVQSSSVAMAITLTMCAQGWLPVEIAASLILGENIGTTSTALIASIIANREAKIAARIHVAFNVIGVLWMVIILPWFLPFLASVLSMTIGFENIYSNALDMTIGLSAFHTAFNLINALLLINVSSWLAKLAAFGMAKGDDPEYSKKSYSNKFLESAGFMPEIAAIQIQKETQDLGNIIGIMADHFDKIINITDTKRQIKLINKIKQLEEATDRLEIEITEHITYLSKEELTAKTSLMFRTTLNVCNDLERIADIYYQLSIILQKKKEDNIYFLPEQREKINEMSALIKEALTVMNENLSAVDYQNIKKFQASKLQKQIKKYGEEVRSIHLDRLGEKDYNIKSAMVYNNVFQSLDSVGKHIMNVTEALVGEI